MATNEDPTAKYRGNQVAKAENESKIDKPTEDAEHSEIEHEKTEEFGGKK